MSKKAFVSNAELLDQKVIYENGPWQRVRRWWRGIHPTQGVIIWGWTGWETVEEKDCFLPTHAFVVAANQVKVA